MELLGCGKDYRSLLLAEALDAPYYIVVGPIVDAASYGKAD